MNERESTCCGNDIVELASAERSGLTQRVTVYLCANCNRIIALGESADPGWVGAKARIS
jgi:hypothetical protein